VTLFINLLCSVLYCLTIGLSAWRSGCGCHLPGVEGVCAVQVPAAPRRSLLWTRFVFREGRTKGIGVVVGSRPEPEGAGVPEPRRRRLRPACQRTSGAGRRPAARSSVRRAGRSPAALGVRISSMGQHCCWCWPSRQANGGVCWCCLAGQDCAEDDHGPLAMCHWPRQPCMSVVPGFSGNGRCS